MPPHHRDIAALRDGALKQLFIYFFNLNLYIHASKTQEHMAHFYITLCKQTPVLKSSRINRRKQNNTTEGEFCHILSQITGSHSHRGDWCLFRPIIPFNVDPETVPESILLPPGCHLF